MIKPISFEMPGNVRIAGTMYTSEKSKGKILFVPGLRTDNWIYNDFLSELADKGFTVYTVNFRGTGLSAGKYDVQQNLLDLECVAKQLAVDGKIALVGHSLGAGLSLNVAKKYPEIISSAYVLGPYLGISFRPTIERIGHKLIGPIWQRPVIKPVCKSIAHIVSNMKGHKFGNRAFEIVMDVANFEVELPDVPHAFVIPSRDITVGKKRHNLRGKDYSHVAKGMRHTFNTDENIHRQFAQDCLLPLVTSIAGFVGENFGENN
jgi:pimeloyl-ACP methyl ester carboxylesterase